VPPVGEEEKGHGTVISHENIPHVRMIIGTDGSLDFSAFTEKHRSGQEDQGQGDPQYPDSPPHGVIGDDLGRFNYLLKLGRMFHKPGRIAIHSPIKIQDLAHKWNIIIFKSGKEYP
jgi:hypothetical protein